MQTKFHVSQPRSKSSMASVVAAELEACFTPLSGCKLGQWEIALRQLKNVSLISV